MWRSLVAAALAYAYGHPGLDDYRPGLLDRPLQAFHRDVNLAARQGQRALRQIDEAGVLRQLGGYAARMDERLRPRPAGDDQAEPPRNPN